MSAASTKLLLDLHRRALIQSDGSLVKLRPQSVQVFEFLILNSEQVISRQQLHKAVWGDLHVTDDSLSQCISDIRRALGSQHRHLLQTMPRKGYKLITSDKNTDGSVIIALTDQPPIDKPSSAAASTSTSACKLEAWKHHLPIRVDFFSSRKRNWALFGLLSLAFVVTVLSKLLDGPAVESPGLPFVVVLPFDNASSDPEQRYFSEGISEEIVTTLNRFSELRIISWDAVSRINTSQGDLNTIIQSPSVRYIVAGSVRKSKEKVRINVRLTDAKEQQVIWSDRYDVRTTDVFEIQDKISTRIATTISSTVANYEPRIIQKKPEAQFEAYDFMLKGRYELRFRTLQRNLQARRYFEKAISIDPGLDLAYVGMALTYIEEMLLGWTEWPARAIETAKANLQQAIYHNELNARAHSELARIYLFIGEHSLSDTAINRAMVINPHNANTRAQQGYNDLWTGKVESSIGHIEYALQFDPYNPIGLNNLGVAYYLSDRFEAASATLLKAQSVQTEAGAYSRVFLTAVYAEQNETEKAAESAKGIQRYYPFFEVDEYVNNAPMLSTVEMRDKLRSSLRKAGLR